MPSATTTRAVILLAGMGSRLGRPYPKSLAQLENGETILSRQLRILNQFHLPVCAVVGFKKELIMEEAPDILYAYNADYDTNNTAKSLLCALRHIRNDDVLWLNGDVVFDPGVIKGMLATQESTVAVNVAEVADEEVKYTLDDDGYIDAISKETADARGEALGINLIRAPHLDAFKRQLERVSDSDYFERAMELLIQEKGQLFRPFDVGHLGCVEVDFNEDLAAAKRLVQKESPSR